MNHDGPPLMPTIPATAPDSSSRATSEEYLSISDLATRIPYAPQTIRNLMSRGVFQLGVHYLKPRGRVIFRWSAVQRWLTESR
jgi:hypothetical protein